MKTETQTAMIIANINGKKIEIINDANRKFVPIKPICSALGIDFKSQYAKLKDDENLSSTMVLSTTVGADGKDREMVCLPLKYIFGWLFTINPGNVSPDAKEAILKYRMECYDILFNHFSERSTFIEEKQQRLIEQSEVVMVAQEVFNQSKEQLKEAKKQYDTIKAIDFNQWKEDRRQLQIPFEN